MDEDQIRRVRSFNRAVTRRIGVLSDSYLGGGRPLAEARLLFEIGRAGAEVRELRTRLSLDSAYLSRLLRSLEAQGLVESSTSSRDRRVRRATLTRKGLREVDGLERRSQAFAASMLAPLGRAQRERLVAAMSELERLLRASAVEIAPADPAGADARTCLEAYYRELDERFERGFAPDRGTPPAPAELVPPRGLFLVARLDGVPIGCGGLRTLERGTGEIKRMWVAPAARGLGVAQRILEALEAHAAATGLGTLRLDTNQALREAQGMYLRNGYREIPRYNDNPHAHHWFEKRGLRRRTPA
ncbi:helix-turn-helix domain-containing GNAT family N-acetyltransferase [Luteimonas sp. RD2P54]|uniref:Helix-turn-helix domain-containing GNAT family N-acetyltransferase n=1 Tax=Luteimonas endophytica TaxID=3042023 RepID=A0ABT6JA27_9GAMM|nr:helix-turn-helix domain-containing GNAT family N-acetyltransferase [Luteimonas endophytica]MDH5823679.1 helix-turn-helix domain-containing GNAT family N-acetyltransferase [Luteimonas endophytica]